MNGTCHLSEIFPTYSKAHEIPSMEYGVLLSVLATAPWPGLPYLPTLKGMGKESLCL